MKKQNILVKNFDSKIDLTNQKSNEFRIIINKLVQVKTSFLQFLDSISKTTNIQQFFTKSNKAQAQLLIAFQNQINTILQSLSKIHQYSTTFQTLSNINELKYEDLYRLNLELTQQNQKYQKKLLQSESEIRRLQECNLIYLEDLNLLKKQNTLNKNPNRSKISYNDQLEAQNQQLRSDLSEAQEFISKNNQQFVRELQKYNEKIWKLQKETESIRILLHQTQNQFNQQTIVVNKLRQQNIQLQILARNLKNLMMQEDNDSTRDLQRNGHMSERPRQNKLREFFKQKIHEGLSKRL